MAGRRRSYAGIAKGLSTIAGGMELQLKSDLDRRKQREEFDQRLKEAGIKAGIESGAIEPTFQGGQFQGFAPRAPSQPMTMDAMSAQAGLAGPATATPGQGAPGLSQGPMASPGGSPAPGPGAPQPPGTGQFSTTINQEFDQYGRVKGFKVTRKEIEPPQPKALSPRDQLFSDVRSAQTDASRLQRAPDSQFVPQAQAQLNETLPRTPMLEGPTGQGGFITGDQVEVLPGYEHMVTPRPAVANALAPGLAPRLRQNALTDANSRLTDLMGQAKEANEVFSTSSRGPSDTAAFRQDIQDAVAAVSQNKISKREAVARLLNAYPDKASKIAELEQQLF